MRSANLAPHAPGVLGHPHKIAVHSHPDQVLSRLYMPEIQPGEHQQQKFQESSSMWCYPDCCGSPKIEVVCKVLLVVATIVLLFLVTLDQNSSLNRWQNTKSMHAADSTVHWHGLHCCLVKCTWREEKSSWNTTYKWILTITGNVKRITGSCCWLGVQIF